MFPPFLLEEIRSRSDLVRIAGEYVRLHKAGPQYQGKCPFHQEKTASFTVHPVKQLYRCWGCGNSGDVFRFVQEIDRIPFPEAVRRLAERAGVEISDELPTQRERHEYRQRKAVAAELADECKYWVENHGGFAREMRRRNLPDIEYKAFEWMSGHVGQAETNAGECGGMRGNGKCDAAWAILAAADPAPWDACNALIRNAKPAEIMDAYLKYRGANPEFRRLYRYHVAEREREDVEARGVCRAVVSILEVAV